MQLPVEFLVQHQLPILLVDPDQLGVAGLVPVRTRVLLLNHAVPDHPVPVAPVVVGGQHLADDRPRRLVLAHRHHVVLVVENWRVVVEVSHVHVDESGR